MKTKFKRTKSSGPSYDIILPVYNAFEETKACIESVLQHTLGHELLGSLVVIDDRSTNRELRRYLHRLASRELPQVAVLRNLRNLGYVQSVNVGMSLSRREIILLNSDTVVTPGWLEKLHKCACSTHQVATVTPLTNNGTICSVPEFCIENLIPLGFTLDCFAELVERVAQPSYPQLPTAVGFCMLIKRKVLNEIGVFDANTFGRGYGEENDFCCRASERGYIHLLDDATFILHQGSSSFQAEKQELIAKNSLLLAERYPDYFWRVHQFVETNPLWEIQDRIKQAIKSSKQ